jgi:hypothetical protein
MRGLRLVLLLDAIGMLVVSRITDPIVSDVALAPLLLVSLLVGIACLSADLVRPRDRLLVACSAAGIVIPFPFLTLGAPWGVRAAGLALGAVQVVALVARRTASRPLGGPRRMLAALLLSTTTLLILVVALVWYGATYLVAPPTGVFTRGPYLTSLTATTARMAWRVHGNKPVELTAAPPDGPAVRSSDGRFRGLRPGTRYVWTANVGGRSAAAGAFTTAPTSTAAPIRLVAFGDYGSGNAHEYAVGRLAAAADPSLFLSEGDNAYLAAAPPLLDRAIFRPLRALLGEAAPVVTLGEHDLAWNDGSAVISALHLPGHHYAVQYGPVQVVVLGLQADSSARRFAAEKLGRCATPCPVRFVIIHRPIASSDPILPLLRRRRVAAILAAHLHRYERHVRGGVLQFTLGTGGEGPGGAQFTQPTPDAIVSFLAYGFLQIDIARGHITYRFVDERGRVRDTVVRPLLR